MKRLMKVLLVLLILGVLFAGYLKFTGMNIYELKDYVSSLVSDGPQEATMEHGWNLILVNADYCIPSDYENELALTVLSNGESVDSRIYPDLQQMFDDMRAGGIYPIVAAGYRTQADQQRIMDERIAAYEAEGYSRKEAQDLAEDWVALPGTSEHQLGIAVDINQDVERSTAEEVYTWLAEHAHEYGFILRYPLDKVDITGISNEPWHYRYVGKEAAAEIHSSGLCLEEYIENLNKS